MNMTEQPREILDQTIHALKTIEGFGMIGEDEVSVVQYLGTTYNALFDAFGSGQRACIIPDKKGNDEILDKKINSLLVIAKRNIDHITEKQLDGLTFARSELTTIAEFIEKESRGIYEPP